MFKQTFTATEPLFSFDFYKQFFDAIELTAGIDGANVVASFDEMKTHGLHWVMADFKIIFIPEFSFTKVYTIVTFPIDANALFAIRAHNIYNAAGDCVAQSFTRWATMQMDTRSVGRIPNHLIDRKYEREPNALLYERLRLQKTFEVKESSTYTILATDVDKNEHTNNTVYMLKCIEAVFNFGLDLKSIRTFSIQFKQETRLGASLKILVGGKAPLCHLKITDAHTSAESSLAEITFGT